METSVDYTELKKYPAGTNIDGYNMYGVYVLVHHMYINSKRLWSDG